MNKVLLLLPQLPDEVTGLWERKEKPDSITHSKDCTTCSAYMLTEQPSNYNVDSHVAASMGKENVLART